MSNNEYINLNRAVISVAGEDAYKFLQGIITNDLGRVTDKNAIYTYLLTPQGKYIFDFFISKKVDEFFIDIAESDKGDFLKKLKMYKLRSKVEISDLSAIQGVYAVLDRASGYADPRSNKMPNRFIETKDSKPEKTLPIEKYHQLRIENNIPEGVYDLEKDKSYPLHYRMVELNGVDFKKGCYVGQEVTTRTHHRGAVRRTTYVVESPESLADKANAEIRSGDDAVGKILSASNNKAIALVEKEVVEANKPLTVLGITLKIV